MLDSLSDSSEGADNDSPTRTIGNDCYRDHVDSQHLIGALLMANNIFATMDELIETHKNLIAKLDAEIEQHNRTFGNNDNN